MCIVCYTIAMNICEICNREYEYCRNKGGTRVKCNSCSVNERRIKLRKKIVDHMGGQCVKCGYDKCYGAMHAHHLDPSEKDFNISGSHSRSWAVIEKELGKCILICSNCHSEEHHDCARYNCF